MHKSFQLARLCYLIHLPKFSITENLKSNSVSIMARVLQASNFVKLCARIMTNNVKNSTGFLLQVHRSTSSSHSKNFPDDRISNIFTKCRSVWSFLLNRTSLSSAFSVNSHETSSSLTRSLCKMIIELNKEVYSCFAFAFRFSLLKLLCH